MAYAENTKVPLEQSVAEIIGMLRKAGAERIAQMEEPGSFVVEFALEARRIRFRALMLVVKAKLESVESEVETFEQAFLANIVTGNGLTVHERIGEDLALEYKNGSVRPLMLGGPR